MTLKREVKISIRALVFSLKEKIIDVYKSPSSWRNTCTYKHTNTDTVCVCACVFIQVTHCIQVIHFKDE